MKIFLYHNNRQKFLTIFHKRKQYTNPGQCTDTFISAEDFTSNILYNSTLSVLMHTTDSAVTLQFYTIMFL